MLYFILSYICRACGVIAAFVPIISIEAIFVSPILFLLGTIINIGACYLFLRLDVCLEKKAHIKAEQTASANASHYSTILANSNAA